MLSERTPFEQNLEASLRNDTGKWTPHCLEEETLFDLSEQGGKHPEAKAHFAHLAHCNYCFRAYQSLNEIRHLSLSSQTSPSTSSHQVSAPQSRSTVSWVDQVSDSLIRLREALQPRAASFAFSDQVEAVEKRQTLSLDDADSIGSISEENGAYWIKFQHRKWPVGSLVIFEASDESGAVTWHQFVLLRRGFRQATAEVKVPGADLLRRRLTVAKINAERLPLEAKDLLFRSYQNDLELNPAHLSEWKLWAQEVLQTPFSGEVKEVIETISRGE